MLQFKKLALCVAGNHRRTGRNTIMVTKPDYPVQIGADYVALLDSNDAEFIVIENVSGSMLISKPQPAAPNNNP